MCIGTVLKRPADQNLVQSHYYPNQPDSSKDYVSSSSHQEVFSSVNFNVGNTLVDGSVGQWGPDDYLSQCTNSSTTGVTNTPQFQPHIWPAAPDVWNYEANVDFWNEKNRVTANVGTEVSNSHKSDPQDTIVPTSSSVSNVVSSSKSKPGVAIKTAPAPQSSFDVSRKSSAESGSPYRRHTADLIRRIDVLLSHRSAQPAASASGSRSRKPRSGGGQRPRARNVVLRELVELLRKAHRDDEVPCFLVISHSKASLWSVWQAMSLLSKVGCAAAVRSSAPSKTVPSSLKRADSEKSVKHTSEFTDAKQKMPLGGHAPSVSLDNESEQTAWDPAPEIFLSRWVARVSPVPSGCRDSGSSSPVEMSDSSSETSSEGYNAVELVDDWGFEWGHSSSSCSGSSADVLDLLALLRNGHRNSRGAWMPTSSSFGGSFCPELELLV